MTAAHPHDPFRPFEDASPTPAPKQAEQRSEPERKTNRRRGRRRNSGAPEPHVEQAAEIDEAEAELQRALDELDGKDTAGDDSSG